MITDGAISPFYRPFYNLFFFFYLFFFLFFSSIANTGIAPDGVDDLTVGTLIYSI